MQDDLIRDDVSRTANPPSSPDIVVGIGASAGGLEALEQLFQEMPNDTGMAFVVIQHLSPDFESMMDELLVRKTSMPVHMASDRMVVQPNSIHLIPPKKEMIILDGRLLLKDKDPGQGLSLPIDQFFKSLARDFGEKSVAIILSGTGSDGSRGICDVHSAGGLVIVQSEDTAQFDGMPKSAVETGMVDLVLPPGEIGKTLARYVARPVRSELVAESNPIDVNEPGLKKLIRLLREVHGIDFSVYKQTTVLRRIERRLMMSNASDFEEYVARIADRPEELHALYHDLLIGVTQFFRDRDAFRLLESEILPELIKHHPENEEFRVWIAGCATGEEAYSLAILLDELMTPMQRQNARIFATDVHRTSLDTASAGVYDESCMANLTQSRIRRYFTKTSEGYQIAKELRQMIVFAPHNLVKDAPFTRLNLISCRNLLIYLQPAIQKKVISLFHFGLQTGGVLFLGPSEGVGDLEDEFKAIDRHWKFYSKRRDVRLHSALRMPPVNRSGGLLLPATRQALQSAVVSSELSSAYDQLLDMFLPPSVLVTNQRQVVHVFGEAGNHLHVHRGRATGDVLDLFDGELKTAVSGAMQRVAKDGKPTAYTGINVVSDKENRQVKISVSPIFNREREMAFMLISFSDPDDAVQPGPTNVAALSLNLDDDSRKRIESLEIDLRHTRENLQATIEELEASNEELHATNEELVASNEEMQSTNEELHSVNEELYTVNAEYQRKIGELTEMTDDMNHLLESTDVGVLFLDRNLSIRKFTPRIARSFNIIERDLGRSFSNFTHNILHETLLDDIQSVLQNGQPYEADVQDRKGRNYLLRILPYRVASEIDGVVVTLIDVTTLKKAQSDIAERDSRLKGILDNSPSLIYIKDLSGRYIVVNSQAKKVFGREPEEVLEKTNLDLLPQKVANDLDRNDLRVVQTGETIETEEIIPFKGKERTYLSIKYPLRDETGQVCAIAGIKTDITKRKRAERNAHRAVRERDRFLAMLSHELRNPLAAIQNAARVVKRMENPDSRIGQVSDVINRQSDQLSRILDDLLDISRVVQGKIDMKESVLDLRDSTHEAVLAVRSMATAGSVKMETEIAAEPLLVWGDQARLQQVIVNLLVNAIKYTPPGGQVCLNVQRQNELARISISDTGAGMSDRLIKRIFDPFVQGKKTLDRSQGGMGVGLTLVKSIVELHGGEISAHSPGLDQGSTFVVTIPILNDDRAQIEEVPETSNVEVQPIHIVIVEDNDDSRSMLALALEMDGHKVTATSNGLAGLAAIEQEKPDLALVDIGLPEMDGYEVARRCRENKAIASTMLVALTGFGQLKDVDRAHESGFDRHITKPINASDLEALLILAGERKQAAV